MTGAELQLLSKQFADVIRETEARLRQELADVKQRLAALEATAAPKREPRSEDLP